MDEQEYSRRAFLLKSAASLVGAGAALATGGPLVRAGVPAGPGPAARADLPPRTVGLRTMGGDFRFDPPGLRVRPGETVTWLNMGDFHTATAFHPANDELLPGGVPLRIPEGAEPWHSGMLGLSAGTRFRHTPRVEGVYDYFCQPHYSFGMVGRLVVGEPRGGPAATRPLSELNEASRERMPAVETITGPAGRGFEWASRINGLLFLRANDRPTADAAASVEAGVAEDAALAEILEDAGAAGPFRGALSDLLEGLGGGAGYERLTGLADRAKEPLSRATAAAAEG